MTKEKRTVTEVVRINLVVELFETSRVIEITPDIIPQDSNEIRQAISNGYVSVEDSERLMLGDKVDRCNDLLIDSIKEKNQLVSEVTGSVLIPEDQIKPIYERDMLIVDILLIPTDTLYANNCPYCMVFIYENCQGCPMLVADNPCESDDSTFALCKNAWDERASPDEIEKLYELANSYNKKILEIFLEYQNPSYALLTMHKIGRLFSKLYQYILR